MASISRMVTKLRMYIFCWRKQVDEQVTKYKTLLLYITRKDLVSSVEIPCISIHDHENSIHHVKSMFKTLSKKKHFVFIDFFQIL